MSQQSTWIIGRSPSCDLVVQQNSASSRHCRLILDGQRWLLEDLHSTNGTFVDGVALPPGQAVPVSRAARITLGQQTPMPWPGAEELFQQGPDARAILIGRSPDNDHQIDLPMISAHHARILRENGRLILEDTNSRNGVAVNRVENRIQRAIIQPTDEIYFGSYKVSASELLRNRRISMGEGAKEVVRFSGNELVIGRDPTCDQPLDYPMISWRHAKVTRTVEGAFVEDLGSRNGTFVNGNRITGRIKVNPGDQIGLGSFRFQLLDSGALVKREYHGNVTIEAREISVVVGDNICLIEPTSFTIYPSELVALMGPSGAGKTTLLKVLNGYTNPKQGQVLFNGNNLYSCYDLFRLQMGYVPQDDIVHPQLTVAEALRFSVKLRTDLSEAEIEQRIERVLADLEISDLAKKQIGSPERKVLSGGQRKRVNIALELIHETPVLFLDEPTSGLSSYDAEGVIKLLKRLSTEGKTIITTIHQPSRDVFRMFDNLIMMGRDNLKDPITKLPIHCPGRLVYYGSAYPDSIQYFNSRPAQEVPPSDLSPETLLTGLETQPTPAWQRVYHASPYHKQFVLDRRGTQPVNTGHVPTQSSSRPFDLRQWLALTRRNALCKLRDKGQSIILLLQAPLFAILILMVIKPLWLHLPTDVKAGDAIPLLELTKKVVIMQFLLVVAAIWFGCNNAARDIVGEWSVYQRERMVSLKLPSYVFSKLSVLFVVGLFQCSIMAIIVHFGLHTQGDLATQIGVLVLANMIGAAIGLCLSAYAESTESAIALLPVVLLPVIALGGGLQPTYRLNPVVQRITAIVPSRWAFEAIAVEEGQNWYHADRGPDVPHDPRGEKCPEIDGAITDAVVASIPKFYVPTQGDCFAKPALDTTPDSKTFRPRLKDCLTILVGMLVALIVASISFLKMRDIQ